MVDFVSEHLLVLGEVIGAVLRLGVVIAVGVLADEVLGSG